MRHDVLHGTGTWRAEALDAASGPLAFLALAGVMALVAGVIGWAAGTFQTAGILLGCLVGSAIVASAMWGVLHWGVEPLEDELAEAEETDERAALRHAA